MAAMIIKTHGCVSAAKKDMRHTSVLFTGTAKSPFSIPHISITTGLISIKFTYFKPSIHTTLHTKFERNWSSRGFSNWYKNDGMVNNYSNTFN